MRAKQEDPFQVIKRQHGKTKGLYRGPTKNAAQISSCLCCPIIGWSEARYAQNSGMSLSVTVKTAVKGLKNHRLRPVGGIIDAGISTGELFRLMADSKN